ncbi:DUF2975 domain-containing protein [Jeotgalibacillus proteolyticus]|uniref:DUF2975 domain-containing protein n=1 Tax=Jeotgalibacillus proteolyticus TaxID=2082395 RepID=UPI003CF1CF28
MFKQGSTLFLKTAVILMGIPVLALSVACMPWLVENPVNPDYSHILYPIVIGLYLSVIPYFITLFQAFKLLGYIDKNQAFSLLSVKALKKIKYCALIISAVYAAILPFVFLVAQLDDAPGLILIGMVPVGASFIIAIFAAVLQQLLKQAIDLKEENDLMV